MGVDFSISRYNYKNPSIDLESENLLIGYWNRVYFLKLESAALHAEITPFFTAMYQQSATQDSLGSLTFHETISGNGFGFEPGLGFTYIVNRYVGFGITVTYSWAKIYVNREDLILNLKIPETYYVNQLNFLFSFQIYIN